MNKEKHDRLVDEVLKRLGGNNMKINAAKIQYSKGSVKLLGVTVE